MDADERDFQLAFDPASGRSNRLKAFYDDMRLEFPAMNGPDAVSDDDVDNDKVTGYAFYPGFVYMDFRWSASDAAGKAVLPLAERHGLGLFDPQDPNDGVFLMGTPTPGAGTKRSLWARLFGG